MQNIKDDSSNFGYTGKSKLIYQRKGGPRSKTGSKYSGVGGPVQRFNEAPVDAYGDGETKSKLSKAGLQRFNEELPTNAAPSSKKAGGALSGLKSLGGSKAASQKSKVKSVVSQRSAANLYAPPMQETLEAPADLEDVQVK